ncbi:MAG: hypothetical protein IJA26_04675, partial [Clostridia bacterium]|nr:hypothetical protein [Clostridia bacterium]
MKHWQHLSRAGVDMGSKAALISWSGTMFEYLMPEIFMRGHADSLAGSCCRNVVSAQKEFAVRCARPWGISESGYYAFDMHLNYQYRAFGLQSLALSSNAAQDVVSPYAAALALCVQPSAAAENLKRMREMGWYGEYGFFEAADYLKTDGFGNPRLVKSHMAHHQGMILCAICNALRDDALSGYFMDIPQARALALLLEEKPANAFLRMKRRKMPRQDIRMRGENFLRNVRRDRYCADTQLLSGGGTTALISGSGAVYAWHDGIQINRFSGDLTDKKEGMYIHISSAEAGEGRIMGAGGRMRFDAGCAEAEENICGIQAHMKICVSPENGALIHALTLKNTNDTACEVQLAGCFAVALVPQGDMRAHPAFQNLFIECNREDKNALCFTRRPREKGKRYPKLLFAVFGGEDVSAENDMERLVGRNGALGMPGGISECFEGIGGSINPCGALRVNAPLAPGEKRKIYFALAAVKEDDVGRMLRALGDYETPDRSAQLASTLARTTIHSSGITAAQYKLMQRASAMLFDAHFRYEQHTRFDACVPAPREMLWRAGISGDLPIILAETDDEEQIKLLRDIIRMHAFFRDMGVWTDIVLINGHGNDYRQPVRDTFAGLIACSHLAGLEDKNGGVHIIDRGNADESVINAIERAAALRFKGVKDAFVQLERMLDVLNIQHGGPYLPMEAGRCADEEYNFDNGYGGFKGGAYCIRIKDGMLPPAPWSNIMAEGEAGAVVTERCGGFAWSGNSRASRLTAFSNDTLSEGWGWMFYAVKRDEKRYIRLLPG